MENSDSLEVLSEVIAALYDCAIDPGAWPDALALMCREMAFRSAALNIRSATSGALLLNMTTGIESPWLEMMESYGREMVEQWGSLASILSRDPNEPALLSVVNPEGLTDHNRVYREWTKPRGMIDVLGLGLVRDTLAYGTIAFGRHRDAGSVGERELAMTRLLLPHLQRAVAISRLLDVATVKAVMFEGVVDALSIGVILTDPSLRIVHANSAAQQMLSRGVPVRGHKGSFSIPSPGATAAIATAVTKAAAEEMALGGNGFGVPLRFANGETHVFHVLPLRGGRIRPAVSVEAAAAIFIAPTQRSPLWPDFDIGRIYDLTPAEARVFEGIASGHSVAAIAEGAGVSTGTVRTHLLQVFAKTGCHRQADLVALAASMRLPVW